MHVFSSLWCWTSYRQQLCILLQRFSIAYFTRNNCMIKQWVFSRILFSNSSKPFCSTFASRIHLFLTTIQFIGCIFTVNMYFIHSVQNQSNFYGINFGHIHRNIFCVFGLVLWLHCLIYSKKSWCWSTISFYQCQNWKKTLRLSIFESIPVNVYHWMPHSQSQTLILFLV